MKHFLELDKHDQKLLFEALCHYDLHRDGTGTSDENDSFHYLYGELSER